MRGSQSSLDALEVWAPHRRESQWGIAAWVSGGVTLILAMLAVAQPQPADQGLDTLTATRCRLAPDQAACQRIATPALRHLPTADQWVAWRLACSPSAILLPVRYAPPPECGQVGTGAHIGSAPVALPGDPGVAPADWKWLTQLAMERPWSELPHLLGHHPHQLAPGRLGPLIDERERLVELQEVLWGRALREARAVEAVQAEWVRFHRTWHLVLVGWVLGSAGVFLAVFLAWRRASQGVTLVIRAHGVRLGAGWMTADEIAGAWVDQGGVALVMRDGRTVRSPPVALSSGQQAQLRDALEQVLQVHAADEAAGEPGREALEHLMARTVVKRGA